MSTVAFPSNNSFFLKVVTDQVIHYGEYLRTMSYNYWTSQNALTNFMNTTSSYRLFWLLLENIRMDMNYLLYLDLKSEWFGFPGLRRNIRNSIEILYALLILSCDMGYENYLRFSSTNRSIQNKYDNTYVDKLQKKFPKIDGKQIKYLSIDNKADFALACVGEKRKNHLADIRKHWRNGNSYVHPDPYVTDDMTIDEVVCELLEIDFHLLHMGFVAYANCALKSNLGYRIDINQIDDDFYDRILEIFHGKIRQLFPKFKPKIACT